MADHTAPMPTVEARLPADLAEAVRAMAVLADTTPTDLLADAVRAHLEHRRPALEAAYHALYGLAAPPADPAGTPAPERSAPAPVPAAKKKPATKRKPAAKKKRGTQPPTSRRTCERDGCTKKYLARGMCSTHYSRWKRGDEPVAPDGTVHESQQEPDPDGGARCQASGCAGPRGTDGFCPDHARQVSALTAKLRGEFGEDARDEATDRMIAGAA